MEICKARLKIHENFWKLWHPTWRILCRGDELVSTILSRTRTISNRDRAFHCLAFQISHLGIRARCKDKRYCKCNSFRGLGESKGRRIQKVLKEITKERAIWIMVPAKSASRRSARLADEVQGRWAEDAAIVLCFSLGRPAFPVDTLYSASRDASGLRLQR